MFNSGGGAFTGFGQSNNNNNGTSNNSQTPQSTFGGFGGSANTNTPIFGQSPQNTSATNAFGGFGSAANNQQTTAPAFGSFGQPAQQTGTFGFGGANNTSTSSFGTGGTGLFGTPSSTSAAPSFGTQPSSGLFGSSTVPNAFGNSVFSPTNVTNNANTNGTSNPIFAVQVEKEGAGGTGTNHFQSITCMPAYAGSSFEELRMQDYNQHRRYGTPGSSFNSGSFGNSSAPSAFGGQAQSSPFGLQTTTNVASPFGQSNIASQPGVFGSTQSATPSAFGAPASGMFGANNNSAGSNTFGSNPNTSSIFGTSNSGTPSTPFGQTTATPFGVPQNTNSPFGNNANNNSNPFGQSNTATTPKPFSFGNSTQTGNLFGQAPASNNTNSSSFGANNTTSANNTSTPNFFGQSATASTNSGLFGQNNASQSNNSGFSFGASNAPTANSGPTTAFNFGGTSNSTGNSATNATPKPFTFGTPASGTSGTFGSVQNNNTAKPFSFGNSTTASQPSSTGNLFGQHSSSVAPNGNSMFGNNTSSNNLFNADPSASNQASNSTSNFFSKPPGGSLFGSSNPTQAGQSLFGTPQNQIGSSNTNSGVANFGNTQTSSTNGFGQNSTNYGQNYGQVPPQTVGHDPYGANPLFSSIQGHRSVSSSHGPIATALVSASPKKKPAMLPHFKLPTRSPADSPRTMSTKKAHMYGHGHEESRKPQFSLFDENLLLQPDAFSPRTNIKRLVIDRKNGHENFLSGGLDLESAQSGPPRTGEATRLPRGTQSSAIETTTSVSSHDKNNETTIGRPEKEEDKRQKSSIMAPDAIVHSEHAPFALKSSDPKNDRETIDHQYWTSPSMSTLLDYSKVQLSKVKDFKVGRRGFGQISFMSPVDLSTFETIEDVPGKIVLFEGKMCTIYPEENLKPAPGKGLNVSATITLEHCYPLSKDKREPIRDQDHPRFQQHVDRLQRMLGTSFVDYLADTGTWIFKVDHF